MTAEIFNAELVLMVVTSVLSTILTEVFARPMVKVWAATDRPSPALERELARAKWMSLPPLSEPCTYGSMG